MVKYIYAPQWFYGKDILIDVVSIVVLLLIAFFSIKYYQIKKNKNYIYLTLSFTMLALSFLFKIVMNINIYYKVIETMPLTPVTITYQALKASGNLFISSFLLYWFLTLFGFYILYSIYQKQSRLDFWFGTYLLFMMTFYAYPSYRPFHLTLLILLALITYIHARKYLNQKHYATKLVTYSFGIITLSQVFFNLVDYNNSFYVTAEIIQLIGYLSLLITFIMVLRHGRKEDKAGHHR